MEGRFKALVEELETRSVKLIRTRTEGRFEVGTYLFRKIGDNNHHILNVGKKINAFNTS